jgi:hypothetical protein
MESAIVSEINPETVLRKATNTYEQSITRMRSLMTEIQAAKTKRGFISARKMWQLGDYIFKLKDDLEKLSLELDGVYAHLTRDLGVKRMWLEKVIIFRRYLPDKSFIPESLNWGRCRNEPRQVAENLRKGLPLNQSK